MREGANRGVSAQSRMHNESRDKTLDLDFKSYTHVKAIRSFNPYKAEQRTGRNFKIIKAFSTDGAGQRTQGEVEGVGGVCIQSLSQGEE